MLPHLPHLLKRGVAESKLWGSSDKEARLLAKFCRLFKRMQDSDLRLFLFVAQQMARRKAV